MNKEDYEKYYDKALEIYIKSGDKNLLKHINKVAEITEYLCSILKLKKGLTRTIKLGAVLHDIGKTRTVICCLCSAKEHNRLGAKYVSIFFEDDVGDKEKKIIKNIIRYHVGEMPKKAKYKNVELVIALTIVRTADKFAANFKDVEKLKTVIGKLRKGK